MKFVATTDFHNAPELSLPITDKTPGAKGKNIVHKGHVFEIAPDAKSLKGVNKESEKTVISRLVWCGFVVVDDGTPESADAIAKIRAEVAQETKVAEAAEKNKPLSVQEQIALGVANALKQLGVKVPA